MIDSENCNIILGEDSFTGWFNNNLSNIDARIVEYKKTLSIAYQLGVKIYVCPLHYKLSQVLYRFKEKHGDIACIANPQWGNYYYLNGHSLWLDYYRKKCIATNYHNIKTQVLKKWTNNVFLDDYFTSKEIKSIYLRKEDVFSAIKTLNFCDYFIIGNLWYDFLYYANRIDILQEEIDIIKNMGKTPIGIISGGKLPIKILEQLGIESTLIWLNNYYSFPNLEETIEAINCTDLKLIAYRIFETPRTFDCLESITFLNRFNSINSLLIGVDNAIQAKQTISNIKNYWLPEKNLLLSGKKKAIADRF